MQHDDLCEPAMLNKSIPAHVSRVIMEGMNLSGRDRIQTITELVTRLFEQPPAVKPAFEQAHADSFSNEPVRQAQPPYQPQQQPAPQQQPYYDQPYMQPPQQPYYQQDDDYEEYSYEKVNTVDRIKVPIIIGILLLAILLIIVVFFMKAFGSNGDDSESSSSSISSNIVTSASEDWPEIESKGDTEMPDLVGKFYSLTEEKYKDYFKFDVTYEYDNENDSDVIVEQDVEPGTTVAQGSTVKLKVSKGKEGANIPPFTGLTVSQYENELRKAGISNYSKVVSSQMNGTPNSVTQLMVDGKVVSPGTYYSNKDSKKLIIYYLPENATTNATTSATTAATQATTQAVETTAAPPETTQAPQTTAQQIETQPPVITTPPPIIEDPTGEFGEW
jgi:serine/threonine-protein kinase